MEQGAEAMLQRRKVVIVGAGAVGSTFAYALARDGAAEEIVLLDANASLVAGQVLDLAHGQPFFPSVNIRAGTPDDYAGASVVVITAGAAQRPGESRLDLLQRNRKIIEEIVDDIVASGSRAVILVVTNPVDVLAYVAWRRSGWPAGRVIGSGTVLDSARLRYLLSRYLQVDTHSVHAYVLGEHGDSQLVAWSLSHVGGVPVDTYCAGQERFAAWPREKERIAEEVRRSAYHIIDYKGATWFGVGMALVRIVRSLLRDEKSILTVSTVLQGEYGLKKVCLSVPCIVGREGVETIITTKLQEKEQEALERSAGVIRGAIDQLGIS